MTEAADKAVNLNEIERSLEGLEGLYRRKKTAAEDFNEAVKAVAEKANIDKAALTAFVGARVGEKFQDVKKKAEQMDLLFTEVGE